MNVKNRKAEQSDATRAALVAAARSLFAQRGYAKVATEDIVRAAGVTRGALYHHFKDKRDLLAAVFEEVERELTQSIAKRALRGENPMKAMRAGARAFLDACTDPEVRQITLLDAPAVLGWEAWREVGARYGLGLVQASLEAAIEAGQISAQPPRPLAHLLMGALDEAALLVAESDDPKRERREVGRAIDGLLDALTTTPEKPKRRKRS